MPLMIIEDSCINDQLLGKSWKKRFTELVEFKHRYGHCNVPFRFSANKSLGRWVQTQRSQYKYLFENKPSAMTTERIRMLDDIDFSWNGPQKVTWSERYNELLNFKKIFGHCNVPQKYKNNPQLGVWVHTQRCQYRLWKDWMDGIIQPENRPALSSCGMSQEKIDLLNCAGFLWHFDHKKKSNQKWDLKFQELCDFHKVHGHSNIPQRYKVNPSLGRWAQTQRTQYKALEEGKQSSMNDDKISKLESVGFKWKCR